MEVLKQTRPVFIDCGVERKKNQKKRKKEKEVKK